MWERNTKANMLNAVAHDFKIKQSKNNGKLFAFNESGDFELERLDRVRFIWEKYRTVILMIAGFILLDIFLYSFSYLLIMGAIEFFIYHKKKSMCGKHIRLFFNIFKVVLVAEVLVLLFILSVNPMYFLAISTFISSLIVFNFYLFTRLLLLSKEIIFAEIFKLKDHSGFYVWRRQVC